VAKAVRIRGTSLEMLLVKILPKPHTFKSTDVADDSEKRCSGLSENLPRVAKYPKRKVTITVNW
jgi:hypothetical protein